MSDKTDVRASLDQLRDAVAKFESHESNELGPYHVARHNLLSALSAAVLAIGDEVAK
ncbi:hypothetical protein [Mycolicibacterium moriokaense]|uniref:Uncharacterized protein n=1 Tax=Mycolicibacterium moriokaense TaxID=39691 RepID=A0AAD1HA15_9MYCO|nr:hypothetical protein [Mycolicibacterium moriokaense]MCV7041339.1 hypothetical protein [Mycolicibacterium moriokaense]BBX00906.1 hypothetical protein MMOR_18420 [Mycolicibacterium moriokaense]